jgi:hypothetical protein
MRLLLLEMNGAEPVPREILTSIISPRPVVLRLENGLGGVWSDFEDNFETIRVGFPSDSPHDFLRPLSPKPGVETCFSQLFGRVCFARKITDIVWVTRVIDDAVLHGLSSVIAILWRTGQPIDSRQLGVGPFPPLKWTEVLPKVVEEASKSAEVSS